LPRLEFLSERTGFIGFSNWISYFRIVGELESSRLELTTVTASGDVANPRGMLAAGGYLFVADQGDRQDDAPGDMFSLDGSLLRFRLGDDGELTDREVLIGQIPVGTELHGTNGLALGPDGLVYLSLGGTISEVPDGVPNEEWLGTVLRFDFDAENIEIYASGIRNIYDLEFDDAGRLWGVDNDGPTWRGFRAEEVVQIKEGANYGYPNEGTHVPHEIRTDPPVWSYSGEDVEGSAGIELAEKLGLNKGVFIGSRVLHFFRYDEDERGVFAAGDFDFQGTEVVFSRQGYFTVVEASEDDYLFVGVSGLSLNSALYVLDITD